MAAKKKRASLKLLSHSRPPTVKAHRSISNKATRTLIRSHHTLEKQRAKAILDGDETTAAALTQKIELQGGIQSYQKASLLGQSKERGGDSSRTLMQWLDPVLSTSKDQAVNAYPIRMLEVGALSTTNACSKSPHLQIERIDLHSQAEGIKQQDFMERPLPLAEDEQFDIISLSLVLNYVPDPIGRGNMLLRTLKFLKAEKRMDGTEELFPCLFLVLPASCVTNSRYMDEDRLHAIMESMGYVIVKKKHSNKLVYYLWRMQTPRAGKGTSFKKTELRSGPSRNNFAIVIKHDKKPVGL